MMMNNKSSTDTLISSFYVALLLSCCWVVLISLPASAQSNPIVLENQQSGSISWELNNPANDTDMQIKGFASLQSVNVGQSIDLHVHVNVPQTFTIEIYRVGWYGGRGGRLMQSIGPLNGVPQPAPTIDTFTGMVTAPWASAYTLQVPANWTSGVYLAKLVNANGYDNYIIFVVRDENRRADFLYQHPANTSQAYNNFPDNGVLGKSLYRFNSSGANTVAGDRSAVKVSFDRPYAERGAGLFFAWEIDLIAWLEKEGYDVTYSADVDMHNNGASLLNYPSFISGGHDEYWTKEMFESTVAARDAGVNLAIMGANAAYWQSRFENNNRVLVVYKNGNIDPEPNSDLKTIRFRDLGRAEQTLFGVQFHSHNNSGSNNTDYIVQNSTHWVYENSGFADNDAVTKIIGYEIDNLDPNYPGPPANGTQVFLSDSPYLNSMGRIAQSTASIYQASSDAWVFAAGTLSWSWALNKPGYIDSRLQQVTKNILERFIQNEEPPLLTNPGDQSSLENATILLQIVAVDSPSDTLTYSASGLPPGLSMDSASGWISGTIADTAAASYNVSVGVSDGIYNVATAFVWAVNSVNQPPSIINPGAQISTELDTISLSIAATDPDNEPLTFRATNLPNGLSVNPASGQITGMISSGAVGNYSIAITVTDGIADVATSFIWIVNAAPNSEPLLTLPASQTSDEGETISLGVLASDPEDEVLTYSVSGLPANLAVDPTTGVISGTLSMESAGIYSVTVIVSDTVQSVSGAFLWTVQGVNQPPTIVNSSDQTNNEGDTISLQVPINDPDNDAVSLAAYGLPTGLSVDAVSNEILGTLGPTTAGIYSVTLEATDNINLVFDSFVWTVLAINEAPIIVPFFNQANETNETVSLQVVATDVDEDALTFAAAGLPLGLTINSSTGEISGTIDISAAGIYNVNINVSDGSMNDDELFIWTINDSDTGSLPASVIDVDCDNDLDAVDALYTMQYSVSQRLDHGSCPLADSATQLHATAGDINGNGTTDAVDALFMLQCSVGLSNPYCSVDMIGAQSTGANITTTKGESDAGFVNVIMRQEGQTLNIQLDTMDSAATNLDESDMNVAVGTFELSYDSTQARLTKCVIVERGVCHESTDGTVRFTFVDVHGLRMGQSVAELTFNNTDVALTETRTLMLTDRWGHNLAHQITLYQGTQSEVDEAAYRYFMPLIKY